MATQNNVSPAKRKYLGSNARIALAKRHYADYVQYVHMGRWKRARHLDLVCEKLESIMEGKTKRLMISQRLGHLLVAPLSALPQLLQRPVRRLQWRLELQQLLLLERHPPRFDFALYSLGV